MEYFEPILRRVVDNCDAAPQSVTADAGYFSAENVRAAEHLGCEPFIAVGAHRRDGLPGDSPELPNHHTPEREAMRALLSTERGRAIYALRKSTVEPVFGQVKGCRGIRQLSFRGLFKNRCEWLLICATHNVLKLWRALSCCTSPQLAIAA